MSLDTSRLSALSRLFSSAVLHEMAAEGKSGLFASLVRESGLAIHASSIDRVRDLFDVAFGALKARGARDEYIYRAALAQRLFLGKHSLRTACMLTEFRAGDSKADVVILNGTSSVYEIKSERDSLSRLDRQIENYKSVFASVFVIAGENHVAAVVKATSTDVGVLALSRRYQITTVREALDLPSRVSPSMVFQSIRTSEASEVLEYLGQKVSAGPNTTRREELRKRFEALSPESAHKGLLHVLKRSRNMMPLRDLVLRLPHSLHAAALSVPVRKGSHERLLGAIETPLVDALEWA